MSYQLITMTFGRYDTKVPYYWVFQMFRPVE